jgi:hypothetical protein
MPNNIGIGFSFQGIDINHLESGSQGIRGIMPQQTGLVNKEYEEYENIRFSLRNAWNTGYKSQLRNSTIPQLHETQKALQTPFRVVNNAGDLLLRQNYSCGGSCQTFQNRPGLKGLKQRFGTIHSVCDGTLVEPATGNQRWVYDGSDYIRYKKQTAIVKNYNDISYGGANNGSYVASKAIRRF